MAFFSAQNIVKRYGAYTALDKVSIEVPEQCIFGLLGPNGAGKTSLIRIINHINAPDQGTLFFKGEPFERSHTAQIGYLPEERGLYRKMAVGEQALYLAQLKGLNKKDAIQRLKYWFEKFEIGAWWNKKVEELSKGMQQKVQFIVTVLHEPELLILDEPFSGFDPVNANLIKEEILSLKQKGATIIFSTHNMGSVEELCDHIALLNKSRKILDGNVREIRKSHRTNRFEIEFEGNMVAFTNSLWSFAELIGHIQSGSDHFTAQVKAGAGVSSSDLLRNVIGSVNIISFKEIIPSMNDIFISKVSSQKEGVMSNLTE
jgi:ABC-2 type transport system ATP-binding protein